MNSRITHDPLSPWWKHENIILDSVEGGLVHRIRYLVVNFLRDSSTVGVNQSLPTKYRQPECVNVNDIRCTVNFVSSKDTVRFVTLLYNYIDLFQFGI